MKATLPNRILTSTVGTLVLLLAGCQTYVKESTDFKTAWKTGNIAQAVAAVSQKAQAKANGRDQILWNLEDGAVLRGAAMANLQLPLPAAPAMGGNGQPPPPPPPSYLQQSQDAFTSAENKVDDWEQKAKAQVGHEVGAALTNSTTLPYRGYAYDKIMMDTYQALNCLALGKQSDARVFLNKSLQRQKDAVDENAKRIAKAQEAQQDKKAGAFDVDKAGQDGKTKGELDQLTADLDSEGLKPYGNYVNPFAVWLDGLYHVTCGEDASDTERGLKSWERVASMIPENQFAAQDYADAQNAASGKAIKDVTYVIFETGSACYRDQVQIHILVVTDQPHYVGLAFPRPRTDPAFAPTLSVSAGEQSVNTAVICNMDSVIYQEYKNDLPGIIAREFVRVATKTLATYEIQKQANKSDSTFGAITNIVTNVYNVATNQADTRTWITLPKQFQYARVATPANHTLTLTDGMNSQSVTLPAGKINVVYVKSIAPGTPLLINQFALN